MQKSYTIRHYTIMGVMTAVICILAPFSIPIGMVPVTFANLALYVSLYILGMRKAVISCLVYLCMGLVGLPVFSGFSAGPGRLFGPTGGYLLGYLVMLMIAGSMTDRFPDKKYLCFLGMFLGTMVCYLIGTVWLSYQVKLGLKESFAIGVLPFLPGDILKMIVVMLTGPKLRRGLKNAGVMEFQG